MQELKIETKGRFRSIEIKNRGFKDVNHFESTKAQFIEMISEVYGHPKRLIDAELKDGVTDVVIVTFYIMDNCRKDSFLMEMMDSIGEPEWNLFKFLLVLNMTIQLNSSTVLNNLTITDISHPVYTKKSGKLILRAYFQN